jgi:hypothetical protein
MGLKGKIMFVLTSMLLIKILALVTFRKPERGSILHNLRNVPLRETADD